MSSSILIIEDDPLDKVVLEAALSFAGFVPLFVSSGLEALDRVKDGKYAAVLLSCNLSDMDAIQLLKVLRQLTFLPIILLAEPAEANGMVAALNAGADDFVTKSASPKELIARVRATLRRAGRPAPEVEGISIEKGSEPDIFHQAQQQPWWEQRADRPMIGFGSVKLNDEERRIETEGRRIPLPEGEYKILRALAANVDRTVTKLTLIRALGGASLTSETKVTAVYISRLRHLLRDIDGGKWRIENNRGLGWSLKEADVADATSPAAETHQLSGTADPATFTSSDRP
jgi:DNA-binding response OmpR family regulator